MDCHVGALFYHGRVPNSPERWRFKVKLCEGITLLPHVRENLSWQWKYSVFVCIGW
ncbi:hypothetical protein COLO4_07821 [Corchorus olitorius]|uniref:Uncharacterized protein n=1 Tax=Corchorus olitorius TaxID=93759 RepID=A0A1R3KIG0_9ROSI|nr:hypothetical protein COLO4_07821 [Corchorus olitorius]